MNQTIWCKKNRNNDFIVKKNLGFDSITVDRDPSLDKELSTKNFIDNETDKELFSDLFN